MHFNDEYLSVNPSLNSMRKQVLLSELSDLQNCFWRTETVAHVILLLNNDDDDDDGCDNKDEGVFVCMAVQASL